MSHLCGNGRPVVSEGLVFGPRNSLREKGSGQGVHGEEGGDLGLLREQVLERVFRDFWEGLIRGSKEGDGTPF